MLTPPIFGRIYPGYLGGGSGKYSPWGSGLGYFITNLLKAAILVAGLASFAFLIFGGVRWLTSGGDPKAVEEAQRTITNAIIGLTIIVAAWLLARIIETIFGISILKPTFVGPS